MSWTYDEIAGEWLARGAIAVMPEEAVAAFDRCEQVFGRDWINDSRGTSVGPLPILQVITMGTRLGSLDGVVGREALIEKLRGNDASSAAELHAIHLLRSTGQTDVELFPKVDVGGRQRVPDLRIRSDQDPWVYVEVTQPDASEAYDRVMAVLETLSAIIERINRPFDLEVFLRREPTDAEVSTIIDRVLIFCAATDAGQEELPDDLGLLLINSVPSGTIVLNDHGEGACARLAKAKGKIEEGILTRRVVVRVPHSDERAENFLRRESAQLPPGGPGLVMIHMGHAPDGFTSWEPLIRRRFQPTVHTRVGAVCLFSGGAILTERGPAIESQTKLLANPHAKTQLPCWVDNSLKLAGAGYQALMAQHRPTS